MTDQTFDVDGSIVTVWHDGRDYHPQDSDYRQRYGYRIVANSWEYVGNDIRSGCSAPVDVADAARTLFGFLGACAESRMGPFGSFRGGNADLFPEHVGAWAESVSDELSILSMDSEELDS